MTDAGGAVKRHRVEIESRAERVFRGLSIAVRKRVGAAIRGLGDNPRPHGCLKLKGEENAWRIRVGDYRIIYEIHDVGGWTDGSRLRDALLVLVIRIGHRSAVYG
jgi:mRNA interferase RelE/StbE